MGGGFQETEPKVLEHTLNLFVMLGLFWFKVFWGQVFWRSVSWIHPNFIRVFSGVPPHKDVPKNLVQQNLQRVVHDTSWIQPGCIRGLQ